MAPDEVERGVLDDWLAYGDDGRYASTTCVLAVPRQNLKSFTLRARAIFGAAVKGERVLFTAHNYDTTAEMRDELYRVFGNSANDPKAEYGWLNRRVKRVGHTNGHEYIALKNGGKVYFSTRTENAKRGYTVDVIVMDECQALQTGQTKALLPAASAAPLKNPQYIYAGTPPTPKIHGDVFQPLRDRIAGGAGGRACLHEWSASSIEGFTLEKAYEKKYWYMCNPALGERITEAAVEAEAVAMPVPFDFAQERLCWWMGAGAAETLVGEAEWAACRTDEPPRPGDDEVLAYAVKFSADGRECAVVACARRPGGVPHIELAMLGPMAKGVGEYAAYVAQRYRRADAVVVDGRAAAEAMVHDLAAANCRRRVVLPKPSEVGDACAMLVDAVRSGRVTHVGQETLTESVFGCGVRKIGGNGGVGFADAAPARACVAEAAALALWAASKRKRHRSGGEKVRIGC